MMGHMVRLTREVRFGIDLAAGATADRDVADGGNGFAGRPTLTGFGAFLLLRVTVEGEPDPQSGYLLNIKEIDDVVRKRAVPAFREAVLHDRSTSPERLVFQCAAELRESWSPVRLRALELCLTPFLSFTWTVSEPDMIRLSQKFEFSAAHRLHNPSFSHEENLATFGKCNNPHGHGHNYELQVTVAGIPDAKTGRLIAVDELERLVDEHVIGVFDHKHLNLEVPEFLTLNPSVENIAKVIYERLAPALNRTPSKLEKVIVWETPKTWAEYGEGMRAEG
jgi:6-pyruvoyltetrahydropterin/6-carboxytetrahydropterin synthase